MGRALVIGGGLAGLGAALFLRKLGNEVVVFEKHPRLAPVVRGFSRNGLHFDTGFHYAGGSDKNGPLTRYFRALGVDGGLTRIPLPSRNGEILRFAAAGEDFPIVRGREAFADAIEAAYPGTRPAMEQFYSAMSRFVDRSPYLNPKVETFDPHSLYGDSTSVSDFLAALALPPRLATILSFRCLLYGVKPETAHFDEFSLVNAPYIDSASTLRGGGAALVRAFEETLAREGVATQTSAEVVSVSLDDRNRVTGVGVRRPDSEAEEFHPGDVCVYCGPPSVLPRMLPEGALRQVYTNRLLTLKETSKPFIMFGTTRSEFFLHRHVFLCQDDHLDSWFPDEQSIGLERGRTGIYLSGGEGRNGEFPIIAMAYVSDRSTEAWRAPGSASAPEYGEFKTRTAESVREALLAACPEFGGDLRVIESATDVTMRRWSHNAGGSIYGKIHGRGSPPLLPVTRVGGLALAGQNITLPGVLGVLVSAAVAVGSLLGHEKMLKVLE